MEHNEDAEPWKAAFLQAACISLGGVSCFNARWPTNKAVLGSIYKYLAEFVLFLSSVDLSHV
jgi:hypothetical protein